MKEKGALEGISQEVMTLHWQEIFQHHSCLKVFTIPKVAGANHNFISESLRILMQAPLMA